ncbi:MAG: hypothetical protein ACKVOO_00415 [Burkholderiaceae bacterium]
MKSTWLCALPLALLLTSCGRNDETVAQSPAQTSAVNRPEAQRIDTLENKVLSLANAVASAAEKKDVKGVMAAFSPDVQITIRAGNKAQTPREFGYGTYESFLTGAFPLISGYQYQRSGESIRTEGDDIVLSFVLTESYEIKGQRVSEAHTETWHLRASPAGLQIYKVLIDP